MCHKQQQGEVGGVQGGGQLAAVVGLEGLQHRLRQHLVPLQRQIHHAQHRRQVGLRHLRAS